MKFSIWIVAMLVTVSALQARVVTISNSGFTFSPAAVTVNVGDTVRFSIGSSHDAVEVSKAVFDANGSSSNGGFHLPFGGGSVVMNSVGTFYYVCTPHASFGMKGQIQVLPANPTEAAALPGEDHATTLLLLQNSPNPIPMGQNGIVSFRSTVSGSATLVVYDLLGAERLTVFAGWMNAQTTYSAMIPTRTLAPGRYLYRLQQGGETRVRMMGVMR